MKHKLVEKKLHQNGSCLVAFLAFILIGWGIGGCEKQDLDRTFEGPYFVRFNDTTLTYKESYSQPILIRVHNAGPQLKEAIVVNYTVSGTAREGKDYTIVGTKGKVVIPANKSFGEISVKLINNANNILESQNLIFTLTSVDPASLQVGFGNGEVRIGKTMKLLIQDECLFGGQYSGSSLIASKTYTVSDPVITSTDCKNYSLSNWNIGLSNLVVIGNNTLFNFNAEKSTLTFIDNGDNSLTVPAQNNEYLGTNGSLSGTGAWNPRNRQITLNLQAKVRINTVRNDTIVSFRDTTLMFSQTYIPQ